MNDNWISISEKAPPANVEVLATDGEFVFKARATATMVGLTGWSSREKNDFRVTHWQLLPDLPVPTGPFYWARFPSGYAMLYKRGSDDCSEISDISDEKANYLVDWLNGLWREK